MKEIAGEGNLEIAPACEQYSLCFRETAVTRLRELWRVRCRVPPPRREAVELWDNNIKEGSG